MKGIVQFAVTAALVAGVSADSHQHQHQHLHARRIAKRDAVTIATAYVDTDGKGMSAAEAAQCIADGECKVVGTAAPVTPSTAAATLTAAAFFESKVSSSSSSSTVVTLSSSSTPLPSTTLSSSTSAPAATQSSSSSSGSSSGSGSSFPNGTIPCSHFPSDYGAVPLDWLNLGGWASVQQTGGWTSGVTINTIVEATSGGCTENSFCSYACSTSQSKAQWPTTSQGSTGQSIGGLWCNADGYLELTNPAFDTLCQDGLGGLSLKNELSEVVSVCGTNYPGNEMMSIPFITEAGGTTTLNNMNASTGYVWQGKSTSGQFYVNKKGVTKEQGCVWTSSDYPDSAGNWAPINLGAGTDTSGVTWLSIFDNKPTSDATIDFDIEITGDIASPCYIKGGVYSNGGTGCTTSVTSGGSAVFVFKASS